MAEQNEKKSDKLLKKAFKVKVGEQEIELVVKKPTQKQQQDAMRVYNRAFAEAIKPSDGQRGALCRAAIQGELRRQGLWDDEKERQYRSVVKRIADGEKKLKAGRMRLSEGRDIAVNMMRAREEFQDLIADRNVLDSNTAEAQAEQVKFEFQVAQCTYDKAGVPYFKGVEDYNQRADDPVAQEAARHLANFIWGLSDNWVDELPERVFLRAYGYMDKDGRLIDRVTKQYVDDEGNPVSKEGHRLNAEGIPVDENGIPIEIVPEEVEAAPFLDDEGNPVEVPAELRQQETKEGDSEDNVSEKNKEEAPPAQNSEKPATAKQEAPVAV